MNKKNRPELIDTEKQEPYATFYDRKSALVPPKVVSDIKNSPHPSENALPFEKINDLLNPGYLPVENGYCHFDMCVMSNRTYTAPELQRKGIFKNIPPLPVEIVDFHNIIT